MVTDTSEAREKGKGKTGAPGSRAEKPKATANVEEKEKGKGKARAPGRSPQKAKA